MINAQIIADSVNPNGNRITTWVLTYPRFIHAEFMTHRVFSRNASSSRAIPIKKALDAVMDEPAVPEFWGKNRKGMQAAEQLEGAMLDNAQQTWFNARDCAASHCSLLEGDGAHKQIANRIIEPFSHITVIATATEHGPFFRQRANRDAQPEFQVLAYRMLDRYLGGTPEQLDWEQWHTPFMGDRICGLNAEELLMVATARCARVSYLNHHGGYNTHEDDISLTMKLRDAGHWSPFEHCAFADREAKGAPATGNFIGWTQYRKLFKNENAQPADLHAVMAAKPSWITV